MERIIDMYGIEFTRELVDMAIINKGNSENDAWRHFAIEHNIIKKTTKTLRVNVQQNRVTKLHKYEDERGWFYEDVEPYTEYFVSMYNGRNQRVFYRRFKDTELHMLEGDSE